MERVVYISMDHDETLEGFVTFEYFPMREALIRCDRGVSGREPPRYALINNKAYRDFELAKNVDARLGQSTQPKTSMRIGCEVVAEAYSTEKSELEVDDALRAVEQLRKAKITLDEFFKIS